MPACRKDDGVGDDHQAAAIIDVEAVGSEDTAVVDEQARDVDIVADRDAELAGATHEGALDLPAGVVAREGGSAEGMGAEEALRQSAVLLARELRAPADELVDGRRRLSTENLDATRVGEPVRLAQGVRGMLLPVSSGSIVPSAALIPPAARTVCASSRRLLPTQRTCTRPPPARCRRGDRPRRCR